MGKLWQIGSHLLLNGDATDPEDYKRLVPDRFCQLCLTDPPFGVAGEPAPYQTLQFFSIVPTDTVIMTFPVDISFHVLSEATKIGGWKLKRELVIVKRYAPSKSFGGYQQGHIPILVFSRSGNMTYETPNTASTVFNVAEEKEDKSRPLSVWNKLIEYHSYLDDTIIDPFVGTGTTIFACEETGRFCRAMEIDEEKCELIIKRAKCLGMKCKEL